MLGVKSASRPSAVRVGSSWSRELRVRILVHRRGLAALCAAGAVWAGVQTLAPPPDAGVTVQVAARDLSAGTVLAAEHLETRTFATGTAPDGLLEAPVGRALAAPVTRGEAMTTARMVSPGLADHLDGRTGVPVRLDDPDVARLLRVGDRVDAVAVDPASGEPARVARSAVVLSLQPEPSPGQRTGLARGPEGRLVLLAVRGEEADAVAGAAVTSTIQVLFSGEVDVGTKG